MKGKKVRPIQAVATWVRRQPPKVKALLAVVSAAAALVFLKMVVEDHDNLFVAAEAVHAIGISVLIYKLTKVKTCAGLSLKSQILTALFLAVRLYCSFVMEYDIHTVLDLATFVTTIWVIYMIRFKLKSSYMEDRDNMPIYYVVIPCAVISLFIHPSTSHHIFNRICWAFCVYVEAISILPQLRVMQNAKIVEPFTAHYVFALGVARFMTCAHWVLQEKPGIGEISQPEMAGICFLRLEDGQQLILSASSTPMRDSPLRRQLCHGYEIMPRSIVRYCSQTRI